MKVAQDITSFIIRPSNMNLEEKANVGVSVFLGGTGNYTKTYSLALTSFAFLIVISC